MKQEKFVFSRRGIILTTMVAFALLAVLIIDLIGSKDVVAVGCVLFALILFPCVICGWISRTKANFIGSVIPFDDLTEDHEKFYKFSQREAEGFGWHIIMCDGGRALFVQSKEEIPEGHFTIRYERTPPKRIFYKESL